MTTKKPSTRNPYTINAKKRKAGLHKKKSDKRANGKNKQQEILKEANE
jgi:hypothetical protein